MRPKHEITALLFLANGRSKHEVAVLDLLASRRGKNEITGLFTRDVGDERRTRGSGEARKMGE